MVLHRRSRCIQVVILAVVLDPNANVENTKNSDCLKALFRHPASRSSRRCARLELVVAGVNRRRVGSSGVLRCEVCELCHRARPKTLRGRVLSVFLHTRRQKLPGSNRPKEAGFFISAERGDRQRDLARP